MAVIIIILHSMHYNCFSLSRLVRHIEDCRRLSCYYGFFLRLAGLVALFSRYSIGSWGLLWSGSISIKGGLVSSYRVLERREIINV